MFLWLLVKLTKSCSPDMDCSAVNVALSDDFGVSVSLLVTADH